MQKIAHEYKVSQGKKLFLENANAFEMCIFSSCPFRGSVQDYSERPHYA